jgi:methionyl-tRNA formyltransferase
MARLAFFGTPDFSLPCLRVVNQFCLERHHELSLVVSQGDRPKDRGRHLLFQPVKKLALELGLPIAQPETLKRGTDIGERFFVQFANLKIDLAIVVAYGKIIPERILALSSRHFVNVHASLLPRFRGSAPIQRAIEAGDSETGVCLMDMVKKLDEGDIFVCQKTPILSFDTGESLAYRLAHLGSALLRSNLDGLLCGRLPKIPQDKNGIVYAPMLDKKEGLLNFYLPGRTLSNRVHAFDPWPGAYGFIGKKRIKFFDSFFLSNRNDWLDASPGTIVVVGRFLGVKTIDGIIYFQGMQLEGKKAMSIKQALLGFPLEIGQQIKERPH